MTLKLWMSERETILFARRNGAVLRCLGGGCVLIVAGLPLSGMAPEWWIWMATGSRAFFWSVGGGACFPVIMGVQKIQQQLSAQEEAGMSLP